MIVKTYATVKININSEDCIKTNIIYCLTFPNGKKYIGQTTQKLNQRLSSHCNNSFKINNNGYNSIKSRAIRKYLTFDVSILYQGEDLDVMEIEFIKQLDTFNSEFGYNLDEGGKGSTGHKIPETLRKKLASLNKERMLGKIGENTPRAKSVLQFSKDGEFIKEWGCIMDIERELNILHTSICNNLKGLSKSSGGFIWKYKIN